MQILTHSVLFFDTLLLLYAKMIKKLLKFLIHSNDNTHIDAKIWIQKILLEEKLKLFSFNYPQFLCPRNLIFL